MKIKTVKKLAAKSLSRKRYKHVRNVAREAKELAKRYGVDPDKAELAAWLHDLVKERNKDELLQILQQDDIIAQSVLSRPKSVWHGPAAAVYAKKDLGIEDEDVLSAAACHTVGKVGMSRLDKIIFVADLTSKERDFPGVKQLRRLARKDLDVAALGAMETRIAFIRNSGRELDASTQEVLHDLKTQAESRKLDTV